MFRSGLNEPFVATIMGTITGLYCLILVLASICGIDVCWYSKLDKSRNFNASWQQAMMSGDNTIGGVCDTGGSSVCGNCIFD